MAYIDNAGTILFQGTTWFRPSEITCSTAPRPVGSGHLHQRPVTMRTDVSLRRQAMSIKATSSRA
eukprot:4202053-Pyramimonas_sp.AAC.1